MNKYWLRFRKWLTKPNEQRLSRLIKQRKKEIYKYSLSERGKKIFIDLYNPSFVSIASVLFLAFLSGFAAYYRDAKLTPEEVQLIVRLQALEIGIALIFVPITVFVIGLSSRKTESGVTVAEVLLRQTYLFPLAVFVLGLLANFAFLK